MSFLSVVLILFLIMDSIGNVSYFLEILKDIDPKRQKLIIIREMVIALVTMILFCFIGNFLLEQLEVSETTVRVASGVILFLVAIKILYPSTPSLRASLKMEGEPFIVPMAIPLIAGPSVLATIMLYAHDDELSKYVLPAIAIAWVFSVIILLLSPYLEKFLGKNGLTAFERLLGMVLVLLSIQRLLEGIQLFTKVYAPKVACALFNLIG